MGVTALRSERLPSHVEVAVVGAGFSGIGMAARLRREGIDDFVVLERAPDIGGTWWHNTYPGCRCDTPSHLYSFAFAPNPDWSETYARQPEIQAYLRDVADTEGILPHVRFDTEVTGANWDDRHARWVLETSRGTITASCLVGAMGPLSQPKVPDLPGLDTFAGAAFHSACWDHDLDLAGRRVAVIGTGASAVQIIPAIAPQVARLDVFQRTPAWVPPHTGRRTTAAERALYRRLPAAQRLPRAGVYYQRELYVLGWTRWRQPTRVLEAACRVHLRRQVRDPEVRRRLTPEYRLGCKRPTPSNDYYPAFNRPNVELIIGPIAEIRPHGIVTADGVEHPVDMIVFATGFHVTDGPMQHLVRGRGGRTLAEAWDGNPRAYLGTTVAGFPNLFLLLGPNTGNLTTSVVLMMESQVTYVLDCLRELRRRRAASIEVREPAQANFADEVQAGSEGSVWLTGGCDSWYLDETGRNSTLWPDFSWRFDARTRDFLPNDHVLARADGRPIVNERRATVGGTRTRLLELDGEGPPLVLVHGLTDLADFWRPVLDQLALAGQRAVAVDLPGFGHADRLEPGPVLPRLDSFLDRLLDDVVAGHGPAFVVGHSMGGALALRLAARRRPGLLGVVAAPPYGLDGNPLHAVGARAPLGPVPSLLGLVPTALRHRIITDVWRTIAVADRAAPTAEFLDAYTRPFAEDPAGYLATARAVVRELRTDWPLQQVRTPVLLVWGERDRLADPSAAQRVLGTVRDSRLVTLESVGHCPAVEAPDRFTRAVLEFLTSTTIPLVQEASV